MTEEHKPRMCGLSSTYLCKLAFKIVQGLCVLFNGKPKALGSVPSFGGGGGEGSVRMCTHAHTHKLRTIGLAI